MAYYLRLKKYNNTRLESWDNEPFEYFCATNRFGMFPHNFMSFATSRNPGHMSFLFTNKTIICCENLKRDTLYKCKKKKKRSKSKVSLYDVWVKSGSSTRKLQGRSTTPIHCKRHCQIVLAASAHSITPQNEQYLIFIIEMKISKAIYFSSSLSIPLAIKEKVTKTLSRTAWQSRKNLRWANP